MKNKLQQYFPIIRTKEEVLVEIKSRLELKKYTKHGQRKKGRNFWNL